MCVHNIYLKIPKNQWSESSEYEHVQVKLKERKLSEIISKVVSFWPETRMDDVILHSLHDSAVQNLEREKKSLSLVFIKVGGSNIRILILITYFYSQRSLQDGLTPGTWACPGRKPQGAAVPHTAPLAWAPWRHTSRGTWPCYTPATRAPWSPRHSHSPPGHTAPGKMACWLKYRGHWGDYWELITHCWIPRL